MWSLIALIDRVQKVTLSLSHFLSLILFRIIRLLEINTPRSGGDQFSVNATSYEYDDLCLAKLWNNCNQIFMDFDHVTGEREIILKLQSVNKRQINQHCETLFLVLLTNNIKN